MFTDSVLADVDFTRQFADLPEYNPRDPKDKRTTKISPNLPKPPLHKTRFSARQAKATDGEDDEPQADQDRASSSVANHSNLDALAEAAALQHSGSKEPGASGTKNDAPESSSRRNQDQRRTLVLELLNQTGYFPPDNVTSEFQQDHSELFPNKNSLQLKIREVRQKCMNTQINSKLST